MGTERNWQTDGILTAGYLAVAVAIAAASQARATDYEVSIYTSTPTAFWLGTAFAVAVAVGVSLTARTDYGRRLATVLGGSAVGAVVALPLLRGYHFYGAADSLTHLGWARDVQQGVLAPDAVFYPGIHTLGTMLSAATGIALPRALLLVVVVAVLLFFAFLSLSLGAITDGGTAPALGAVGAFLLLPINNVSTFLMAHPFTQATLLSAVTLYLLFRYLPLGRTEGLSPTGIGALLALSTVGLVVYHPQLAANVLLLFGVVAALQLVASRRWPGHAFASHRPLYAQTAFFAVVFAARVVPQERFTTSLGIVERNTRRVLAGQFGAAGENVATQAGSVTAAGGSVTEVFVKLFLPEVVFTLLAGGLVLAALAGWLDSGRRSVVTYLALGSIPVVCIFAVYLLADVARQYFRHVGFLMLISTVVGALALALLVTRARETGAGRLVTGVVVVLLVLVLPLSVATLYPSPYVFLPNQHVTEKQLGGYATAFDTASDDVPMAGLREGPNRYSDAVHGVTNSEEFPDSVRPDQMTGLEDRFADRGYLVVSDFDRQREGSAYRGVRYDEAQFESLSEQPGVDRVFTNGGLTQYFVG